MPRFVAISAALVLGACASTPDVVYNYYLPTSKTSVSVTQTVDCTQDKTALVISYGAPQVTTVNFADYSRGTFSLPVRKLDSLFADSDFSFNLTDDGRLKSINASWTGQGQTILQSAISLGTSLAPLGASLPGKPQPIPECAALKNWTGGKPASIVYSGVLNLGADDALFLRLEPAKDETTTKILEDLAAHGRLPDLDLMVLSRKDVPNPAAYGGKPGDYDVMLTLTRTENVTFNIEAGGKTIYSASVVVPGTSTYQLPVPGAAFFGKQSFALTLTDAGAISSIDYGKETGAAAPFNVAGSIVSAVAPPPVP